MSAFYIDPKYFGSSTFKIDPYTVCSEVEPIRTTTVFEEASCYQTIKSICTRKGLTVEELIESLEELPNRGEQNNV